MRVPRPVPRRALAAASVAVAVGVAAPAAGAAVPDAVATPTTAGPPALVAWSSGRDVLVAGPDGAGRRVVARLRPSTVVRSLSLSADGRRLALATVVFGGRRDRFASRSAVRVADLAAGGPLRTLARNSSHHAVRFSPDGRRALLVGDTIRLCDVAARTPCRGVARDVQAGLGATWAPDGDRFAYVGSGRPRSTHADESDEANVVLNDGAGHERVLERETRRGRRSTAPLALVWTGRGLTWTTAAITSAGDGENFTFTRTSTRVLGADGRTTTITAVARRGRTWLPFVLASGSPAGEPIGLRFDLRGRGDRLSLQGVLLRLGPSGATSPWGLTLAGDVGDEGGTRDVYLGMLADGRAAVARMAVDPAPPPPADARAATARAARAEEGPAVHLATPDGALGPALASGPVVAVATPFPAAPDLLF